MRRYYIAIFLVLGLALLWGCSIKFEIIPENLNSERPSFKFSKPLLSHPKGNANRVELNSFMIVEKKSGEWDYKNPMWTFELKPGKYLEVEQVQYGVVPSGFSEATSVKPLSIGKRYLVMGFGPGSGGSVEFELMK